jgi:hypothetical protein
MLPLILARMTCALKSLTPEMVVRSTDRLVKGLDMDVDLPIDRVDGLRVRSSPRSSCVWTSGTKLPRISPWNRSASQVRR